MNPIARFPAWPAFAVSLCCHAAILLLWPAAGPLRPVLDTEAFPHNIEVTLSAPHPAPASLYTAVMRRIERMPAPAAGLATQPDLPAPSLPAALPAPPAAETLAPATVSSAPTPSAPVDMAAAETPLELPRFNAAYLDNPVPTYPLAARRRGIEGKVLVRAEVQDSGNCSQVMLKQSSGYDMLDQAALAAVKNWRFVPARRGETAAVAWVDVPIVFRLQD